MVAIALRIVDLKRGRAGTVVRLSRHSIPCQVLANGIFKRAVFETYHRRIAAKKSACRLPLSSFADTDCPLFTDRIGESDFQYERRSAGFTHVLTTNNEAFVVKTRFPLPATFSTGHDLGPFVQVLTSFLGRLFILYHKKSMLTVWESIRAELIKPPQFALYRLDRDLSGHTDFLL